MSRDLPPNPDLIHLKKQAKHLLKAYRAGDMDACRRIRDFLPRLGRCELEEVLKADVCLQEVQHVIACEYGYENWKSLLQSVQSQHPYEYEAVTEVESGLDIIKLGGGKIFILPKQLVVKSSNRFIPSGCELVVPFRCTPDTTIHIIRSMVDYVARATWLAFHMQHDYVGTEHLLLALLRKKNPMTRRLTENGLRTPELISYIKANTQQLRGVRITGEIRMTQLAQGIMEKATEAEVQSCTGQKAEFMMVELARETRGLASKALQQFGLGVPEILSIFELEEQE